MGGLHPVDRQQALRTFFSQKQRLALEAWVVQCKKLGVDLKCDASRSSRAKRLKRDHEATFSSKAARAAPKTAASNVTKSKSKTGIPGVETLSRGGRQTHRASASVGPFRIITPYVASIKDAERLAAQLASVLVEGAAHGNAGAQREKKYREGEASAADATSTGKLRSTEARFKLVLNLLREEQKQHSVLDGAHAASQDANVLARWRFFVTVPAKCWIGRDLRLPSFSLSSEAQIEEGVAAWRRIYEVRSQAVCGRGADAATVLMKAWQDLRRVYAELWAKADARCGALLPRLAALDKLSAPRLGKLRDKSQQQQQQDVCPFVLVDSCNKQVKTDRYAKNLVMLRRILSKHAATRPNPELHSSTEYRPLKRFRSTNLLVHSHQRR